MRKSNYEDDCYRDDGWNSGCDHGCSSNRHCNECFPTCEDHEEGWQCGDEDCELCYNKPIFLKPPPSLAIGLNIKEIPAVKKVDVGWDHTKCQCTSMWFCTYCKNTFK